MKRVSALVVSILLALTACRPEPPSTPDPLLFQFGILADIQYGDKPNAGKRLYRESLARLEDCLSDWANHPLSFTVQLGDIIEGHESKEASRVDLNQVLDVYSRLSVPRIDVIGNHCLSLPRDELLTTLGMKENYYSFVKAGWRFVVLDSLDVSVCGREEGSPLYAEAEQFLASHPVEEHRHAQRWNGGLGAAQLEWLREELVRAKNASEWVVVFAHHPVRVEASSAYHLLWNHQDVAAILAQSDRVVAYLNGHDHSGGYARRDGIHYWTLPGMVESQKELNAYARVEVYEDRLEVLGVGHVESRTLSRVPDSQR